MPKNIIFLLFHFFVFFPLGFSLFCFPSNSVINSSSTSLIRPLLSFVPINFLMAAENLCFSMSFETLDASSSKCFVFLLRCLHILFSGSYFVHCLIYCVDCTGLYSEK